MKKLALNPGQIIPWGVYRPSQSLIDRAMEEKNLGRHIEDILEDNVAAFIGDKCYDDDGWRYVPPILVLGTSKDLKKYGEYLVVDGNHRWNAARMVGINLTALILESDEDLRYIKSRGETIITLDGKSDPFNTIEELKDFIYEGARRNFVKKRLGEE